jgi:steroid Delta-isomerase
MPDKKQVRAAIERHVAYWNAGQRGDWIANFSEDVVFNDPVGSPPKHGREAAQASWDNSFTDGQAWTLELTSLVVCADEAAITLNNHGQVGGKDLIMQGIEIWKVDSDGLVCEVRAYFEPPEDIELDPYFGRDS